MTDAPLHPSPTAPASSSADATPLDEVMLAMDLVDVLRHEESLVSAELDEEGRRAALVARIQEIYAAQGMEVPEEVIARGVEALREDRFAYRPPERTFAVRLAEVYVDRGRWLRRALLVGALVGALLGGRAWANARRDRRLVEGFAARVESTASQVRTLDEQTAAARRALEAARATDEPGGADSQLLDDAARALSATEGRLAAFKASTASEALEPANYPRQARRMDGVLEARNLAVTGLARDLGNVRGQLDVVERLRGLAGEVERAQAGLAGLALDAAGRARVEALVERARAALLAGDEGAARQALAEVEALVRAQRAAEEGRRAIGAALSSAQAMLTGVPVVPEAAREVEATRARVLAALTADDLETAQASSAALLRLARVLGQAYELRIVSRPGERSGVWRHPVDRREGRNHYVIVEAVDAEGRVVPLEVTSEEDGRTREVTRFGLRVTPAYYDAVGADKRDNGIVDDRLVGVKRRGVKDVEYRVAVAGGRILDW